VSRYRTPFLIIVLIAIHFYWVKKDSIRYRIREKIISRVFKKNKRRAFFPQLDKIKSVGIICQEDQNRNLPANSLFSNSRIVKLVLKNEKPINEEKEVVIYSSDYNILGLPKKKWINNFIKQRFSILIDFSTADDRAVEYICALSNAEFLVGTNPKSQVFDLIIDQKFVNSGDLFNVIEKTLQNLNQKAL
jgi:hypothetical protein